MFTCSFDDITNNNNDVHEPTTEDINVNLNHEGKIEIIQQQEVSASSIKRQHQCTYCSKQFAHASHLERHLITHTNKKPFLCFQCGKQFSQTSTLDRHQLIKHAFNNNNNSNKKKKKNQTTTMTTYQCEHCLAHFSLQHNLKAHIKKLHIPFLDDGTSESTKNGDGKLHFCCFYCKTTFSNRSTLNKHINYRHGRILKIKKSTATTTMTTTTKNCEHTYFHHEKNNLL